MSRLHPNSSELFAHELVETTSIGGRKNVNVVIGAGFAATDGKNVYYPKFADGVVLTDEQVSVARALKHHEAIGHLRFTNIGVMRNFISTVTPLKASIAQSMEDVAIEHRVMHGGRATDGEAMPGYLGTKADFSSKSEFVAKRVLAGGTNADYSNPETIVTHGFLTWAHTTVLGYDAPSTRELAKKIPPYLRPVMQEFAERATKAATTGDRMALVEEYLAAIKAAEPPPPPPPPPPPADASELMNEELEKQKPEKGEKPKSKPKMPEPEPEEDDGEEGDGDGADGDGEEDDEGEGDTGSGDADGEGGGPEGDDGDEGGGEDEDGDEGDGGEEGDGDDGDGDEEDGDGDGGEGDDDEGEGGGDEDEGEDGEGDDDGGDGEDDGVGDAEAGADASNGYGAVDGKIEIDERKAGAVHEVDTRELMGAALAGAHEDTWMHASEGQVREEVANNAAGGLARYNEMKQEMSAELAVIVSKLPRLLEDKARSGWLRNQPVGRLDTKRLVPVVARYETNVFRRREDTFSINTAVTVLVDHSGSMMGRKMRLAAQVCVALAEALERVSDKGLAYEILGWQGAERGDYRKADALARQGVSAIVVSGVTKLIVYKSFRDRLQVAKPRLAGMPMRAGADNCDMAAIEAAAKRLMPRMEPRRILMVLSDGAPACSYYPSAAVQRGLQIRRYANSLDPLINATKREARKWQRAGIEMVGVGIADDNVLQIYDKAVVVRNISDLAETVFQQLGQLLLGGRFVASNNADKMAMAALAAAGSSAGGGAA